MKVVKLRFRKKEGKEEEIERERLAERGRGRGLEGGREREGVRRGGEKESSGVQGKSGRDVENGAPFVHPFSV